MSFEVDAAALRQIFFANSKKYHPDFYTLESEEKQAEILELSTLNNQAYKTLSDFDKRMKYILELKEVLGEEGQNKIPQDFLMEMMDINEKLMELEFDYDSESHNQVTKEINQLEQSLLDNIQEDLKSFASNSGANLISIKEYYLKKRYLLRIRENLNKFASA